MIRLPSFLKWAFQTGDPDPEAFLDDIRTAQVGHYSRSGRYRDFRAVFQGHSTPAQGRRVLWQIFFWGRMYAPVAVSGDPHMTYFRDGERNIGLRIMQTMNMEPGERADKAISQQPEE